MINVDTGFCTECRPSVFPCRDCGRTMARCDGCKGTGERTIEVERECIGEDHRNESYAAIEYVEKIVSCDECIRGLVEVPQEQAERELAAFIADPVKSFMAYFKSEDN